MTEGLTLLIPYCGIWKLKVVPGTFLLILFTVSIYSCYLESPEINRFQLFLCHNFSYTRILINHIWSVASQRRSTWFEVLVLLIVYRDINKYKCCLHLDLNIVYTVSSHLVCSFRRKRLPSDHDKQTTRSRIPLWPSGITMKSPRSQ